MASGGWSCRWRELPYAHFVDADADRQYDSGSETLFDKFDYSYFADGSRAAETRTNADGTTTALWTYDGLNRLTSEEFDGFDGQGDPLEYVDTYSFDLASNRTELVHDDQTSGGPGSAGPDATTTYEYDANDRLLAETRDVAGSTTENRHTVYGYSPTDQTSKTVHEGLDDQGAVAQDIDFVYDATGRMTGVTMTVGSTTTTVTYTYDASGFRVEARVDDGSNPPVTTIFHVDPNNPTGYIQVVEEGVDADGDGRLDASEIEKAFVIGLDLLTQATASALLHLLTDAHGSTKSILNAATSSVVDRYVYSAYGLDLGLGSSPATTFRYAGEFIDPVTGLSFNRARWYSPSEGRFHQIDPFEGVLQLPLSLARYLYANANPIHGRDPSGLFTLSELLVVIGIVAIGLSLVAGYLDATKPGTQVLLTIVPVARTTLNPFGGAQYEVRWNVTDPGYSGYVIQHIKMTGEWVDATGTQHNFSTEYWELWAYDARGNVHRGDFTAPRMTGTHDFFFFTGGGPGSRGRFRIYGEVVALRDYPYDPSEWSAGVREAGGLPSRRTRPSRWTWYRTRQPHELLIEWDATATPAVPTTISTTP